MGFSHLVKIRIRSIRHDLTIMHVFQLHYYFKLSYNDIICVLIEQTKCQQMISGLLDIRAENLNCCRSARLQKDCITSALS